MSPGYYRDLQGFLGDLLRNGRRGFIRVKGGFRREGIRGRRLEMAAWEVNYQRLEYGAASTRFRPGQGAERMTTDVLAPETKGRHVLRGINAFC